MKTGNQIVNREAVRSGFHRILIPFMMFLIMLLPYSGLVWAQGGGGSSLAPWIGIWRIVDEGTFPNAGAAEASTIVEIRPTSDRLGLEISRQTPQKTEVKEVIMPDGIARPIEGPDCTGTQTARWLPEAGAIAGSSETKCKDTGTFATSSLRLLLPEGKMADILAVKTSGQTRLAIRHLTYMQALPASGSLRVGSEAALIAAQTALSAPWTLDRVIQFSSLLDTTVLEAALLEKNLKLDLTAKSLKRLEAAGVPDKIIDLLVALAFPGEFEIQKNGQIELKPPSSSPAFGFTSARVDLSPYGLAPGGHYYSGAFYGCPFYDSSYYGPYYLSSPYADLYSRHNCWTYYSPFWWDYPMRFYDTGYTTVERNNARLNANEGYTQVGVRDNTGRRAVLREAASGQSGNGSASQTSADGRASNSGSSSSGGSSGSGSSGSSSSSPSASPGGYSSGRSNEGSGSARPR